ncbi:MAG: serine--tRNA ligase [Sandaracinaceae bacterium]
MLDLRYVTEHLDEVRERLATRGGAGLESLAEIAKLAEARSEGLVQTESLRQERNDASKAMASVADKASPEFAERRQALKELGQRIKDGETALAEVEQRLTALSHELPNLPHESVPVGKGEHDNQVVRVVGEKPALDFAPKQHDELGTALGIIDFERGAKLSGARFTVLRGMGARLERSILNFMLDLHTREHGYEEMWPPVLVRDTALFGTGQLPKFETDVFEVKRHYEEGDTSERTRLFLSPTSEVQLTNLHANEIFEPGELPRRYTAFTPCFRSEAGSYGKDTRGLIRQHQFDKVELVHFCEPDAGLDELERLLGSAERVLQRLGLHYRVSQLCTGDMGFGARKTYDIEVWLPGQDAYREISSCSWCGDFQARRAMIRYRPASGDKPRFAHTLNGSGLAVGRTLIAILEQYQAADGSVRVPGALVPYMGCERIAPC